MLARWSFSLVSPLSMRKSRRAWKLPWKEGSSVLSSLFPLRGELFWPQKMTILIIDLIFSRLSLIWRCTNWFSCWSIGTVALVMLAMKLAMETTEKLCVSHFPAEWFCNRTTAVVQNVNGVFSNLSSRSPFFPHSKPKQTQGKQKAPSKYFKYASHW